MGSSGRDWQAQIQHFASVRTVITIDLRGHGNSRCLDGEYSIQAFSEDVIHTLNHLKVDRCHMVGLSLGGVVGAEIALSKPKLLHSLTLVNAPTAPMLGSVIERWQTGSCCANWRTWRSWLASSCRRVAHALCIGSDAFFYLGSSAANSRMRWLNPDELVPTFGPKFLSMQRGVNSNAIMSR